MRKLSDLEDNVLMIEYQQIVERLQSLDPELPKGMREIRVKYRDYVATELLARGLLAIGAAREMRSAAAVRKR